MVVVSLVTIEDQEPIARVDLDQQRIDAFAAATGDLHVTVKDSKGNVITNASVAARDEAKGLERTTSTNLVGQYSLLALPPGTYKLTMWHEGFHAKGELFVFVDVHEDEIFDCTFGMPNLEHFGDARVWWDIPANRHNQGASLSFGDGHVERWKWKVPKVYRGLLPQSVPDEELPDYRRMQEGYRQSWK